MGPGPRASLQQLMPEAAPGAPPGRVRAEAVSDMSVVVSYDPPAPWLAYGVISGYYVHFWPQYDPDPDLVSAVFVEGLNVTLTGLPPYTNISVAVATANEQGNSSLSTPAVVTQTFEAQPQARVNNPRVLAVTTTTATVGWDREPFGEVNGELLGLKIALSPNAAFHDLLPDDFTETTVVVLGWTTNVTLTDLAPAIGYDLTITLFNSIGDSAINATLQAQTLDSVPSAAPQNIRVTQTAQTNVSLAWDELAPAYRRGTIIGYRVINHRIDSCAYMSCPPPDQCHLPATCKVSSDANITPSTQYVPFRSFFLVY